MRQTASLAARAQGHKPDGSPEDATRPRPDERHRLRPCYRGRRHHRREHRLGRGAARPESGAAGKGRLRACDDIGLIQAGAWGLALSRQWRVETGARIVARAAHLGKRRAAYGASPPLRDADLWLGHEGAAGAGHRAGALRHSLLRPELAFRRRQEAAGLSPRVEGTGARPDAVAAARGADRSRRSASASNVSRARWNRAPMSPIMPR